MKQNVAIIGAGIAGLTAALALEKQGYTSTIYDSNNFVGGRVTSEAVSGHALDVGFQVLLTAYPLAKKYLDYQALNLVSFENGSKIVSNGKMHTIGDAGRKFSFLWATLVAPVGSLGDKMKIFKLSKQLKAKSIEAIFETTETTTLAYLQKYGFTTKIIENFFRPFFGGIFLERKLDTSSRMFEFIFKMFSEGDAAIPSAGMQAIPDQLASKLHSSNIHLNTKISSVQGNTIHFENEEPTSFDYIIVTSKAEQLISNLKGNHMNWKGTSTLYFELPEHTDTEKFIYLSANDSWINSVSFPKTTSHSKKQLLSVSIIKPFDFDESTLIEKVSDELARDFDIYDIQFLKAYHIPNSLPVLSDVKYSIGASETQLTESIYLAGDSMLNGSLNAAMLSGELAATAIHEKITGTIVG